MFINWKKAVGTYVNNFYINDVKHDEKSNAYILVTCHICGEKKWMSSAAVKNKKVKSCGCNRHKREDIAGQKFGKLTAIEIVGVNQKRKCSNWLCDCDCGKTAVVSIVDLKRGYVKSCGCLLTENWDGKTDKMQKASEELRILDTYIPRIQSEVVFKNNKSGVRGVCWDNRCQKWHAYIYFQKKRYRLGYFKEKQDAINVRKKAEAKIYGDFLSWYAEEYPDKWKKNK